MTPLTMAWPGGEHDFALDLGRLRAIQEATNAGPLELLGRFDRGTWRVDDVLAVLSQGLVGAGMELRAARAVVAQTADHAPLLTLVPTAHALLALALSGPPEEAGKDAAEEDAPEKPQPRADGISARSTAPGH